MTGMKLQSHPANQNRQWVLQRTPAGRLSSDVFMRRETPIPAAKPGEVLIRNLMLSLDPAARGWMKAATYRAQVLPGDVMHGFTVGQVVSSLSPSFSRGDVVECMGGWQDYIVLPPDQLLRRDGNLALEHLVSIYGITGITAYHGLFEIGRPRPGDVVLVSAAAGAVGSIAGQLAKLAGCRVIGIAGGREKCDWVIRELGFADCIDYKAGNFREALREACAPGIDIYFDNVGGPILDAALGNINFGSRIVCCGSVSRYDAETPPAASLLLPSVLTIKRSYMEGFIVLDYGPRRAEAERRLERWVTRKELRVVTDIVDGFEHVPGALVRLLAGGNRGKSAVRIGDIQKLSEMIA